MLLLGLAASLLSNAWVTAQEERLLRCPDLEAVVFASRDVDEGEVVTLAVLEQRMVPARFVTATMVRPDAVARFVGRRLALPLRAGDVVRWSHAERTPQDSGPGIRALEVTVQGSQLVRAGDHLDVIGSVNDPHTGERVAKTLIENVVVGARSGEKVALLVLPEEAERLLAARALTVTLRNPEDLSVADVERWTSVRTLKEGLFEHPPRRGCRRMIQLIRGSP